MNLMFHLVRIYYMQCCFQVSVSILEKWLDVTVAYSVQKNAVVAILYCSVISY